LSIDLLNSTKPKFT